MLGRGGGDSEALRLFEIHYISQVPPALRRFGSDAALVDEVAQRVRVKLFVAAPGELGADHALRARRWPRRARARRRDPRSADPAPQPRSRSSSDEPLDALVGEADPELRALKERYAQEFQRAFTAAVAELPARERHLLRLNLSAERRSTTSRGCTRRIARPRRDG